MGRGRFLRSLKQRWWLLVIIVLPATLGTMGYSLFKPTEYEAFMTLADRRDVDMNLPPIFQDQMMGRGVNEQEMRVMNLANTIGSYTVLKGAWDEVAQPVLKESRDDVEAQRKFFTDVSISPVRGTEYITVSYIADNPDAAKRVMDAILSKFRSRFANLNANIAIAQVKFLEEQLAEQRLIYNKYLQEQQEFMEQYPTSAPYEAASGALLTRINFAQDRYAKAEGLEAGALQTLQEARKMEASALADINPMTVSESRNPLYLELQSRVKQGETVLATLRERYGPNHPRVIEATRQYNEDRKLLSETQPYEYPVIKRDIPEFRTDLLRTMMGAQQSLAAARAEKANAQRELQALYAERDKLPVVQKRLTELSASIQGQASMVANLANKVSEAKVRAAQNMAPRIYMLDDPQTKELARGTVLKTLVALFLSLVVAVSLIASLGQFDQGTYTPMEAENSLGFPVLAALPKSHQQRLSTGSEQPSALAASYQLLSAQLFSIKDKLNGPGILVAAAEPNCGRTTVAANLAISLARDGARVLLVDADLRSPNLHTHFGLQNRAGLSEILSGTASVEDVVQPTGVDGLLLIAAGQPPVNPVRLFHSSAMSQFVEQISQGADYIVFDSPAGSTFADSQVIAGHVQNIILVHEAGQAPSGGEFEFHKALERLGVNIIGMVLNKTRPDDCPAYQHFRRNYESDITRRRLGAAPALSSGDKPVREKQEQYGQRTDDDEE